MLLKIIQVGDETLRKKAKRLTAEQIHDHATQYLIDLMIKTVRDNPGVGLAAPQVGEQLQIIVIEDKKEYHEKVAPELLKAQGRKPVPLKVIINPQLVTEEAEEKYFFEGCLSANGYLAIVPRAKKVTVTGLDRKGKPIKITAEGWFARILQHEIDHLGGTIYVDKMLPRTFITAENYVKKWSKASDKKLNQYVDKIMK